jgi:wyosine [tRNA(Phe)-imidazoG37] synthetase (radical SAM superfamily)
MENEKETALAFGPVPSRRLGRSLGINNIPLKSCTYSCLYCQVGQTLKQEVEPHGFYTPQEIRQAVVAKINVAQRMNERIDYLTFVPDGEPTLDARLDEAIDLLRPLGIRIAVISNASLIWRDDVQSRLNMADWVSLKVDSVDEATWRRINRPHAALNLPDILAGITRFAHQYPGELVTETMLVKGVNDSEASIAAVTEFLRGIRPHKAYLSIPTRPPAEPDVRAPSEAVINSAYQLMQAQLPDVEYLIGYEGEAFAFTGNLERDLLSITAVHPMREEAVRALFAKAGVEWDFMQRLLAEGKIRRTEFAGKYFYVRSIQKRQGSQAR